MSDLIPPPEAVEKMDALERLHRLPASDGGGVVFPFGFFGPGYHLSEAEFRHFSALADHLKTTLKPRPGGNGTRAGSSAW